MSYSRFPVIAVCTAALMLAFSSTGFITGASAAKSSAADASSTSTRKADGKATAAADRKVIVYYFHGDARCTNCINFEKYSVELMKTTFADAIKNGSIEWRVVNTDQRGNEHFMQDYQLFTKSLVLVETKAGKQVGFKNLTGIWQTVGDKGKFQDYVRGEIQAYQAGR
ncbi:MAG: hypothetical protein K1X53_01020 [Candidatus Sumerlaeaceae bacterium]|nr:hypothetical protein [Candidatus Sumerlaeaceae bacterium]